MKIIYRAITVFFGVPKGDKLDRVVRQLSELGVNELVLVNGTKCCGA